MLCLLALAGCGGGGDDDDRQGRPPRRRHAEGRRRRGGALAAAAPPRASVRPTGPVTKAERAVVRGWADALRQGDVERATSYWSVAGDRGQRHPAVPARHPPRGPPLQRGPHLRRPAGVRRARQDLRPGDLPPDQPPRPPRRLRPGRRQPRPHAVPAARRQDRAVDPRRGSSLGDDELARERQRRLGRGVGEPPPGFDDAPGAEPAVVRPEAEQLRTRRRGWHPRTPTQPQLT